MADVNALLCPKYSSNTASFAALRSRRIVGDACIMTLQDLE